MLISTTIFKYKIIAKSAKKLSATIQVPDEVFPRWRHSSAGENRISLLSLCILLVIPVEPDWQAFTWGSNKIKTEQRKVNYLYICIKNRSYTNTPFTPNLKPDLMLFCWTEFKILIQIQHIENEIELVTSWILWKIQLFNFLFGFHSIIHQVSLNMLWCSDWGTRPRELWIHDLFFWNKEKSDIDEKFVFKRKIHLKILD